MMNNAQRFGQILRCRASERYPEAVVPQEIESGNGEGQYW